MYKPFSRFFIIFIFIYLVSCTPVNNNKAKRVLIKNYPNEKNQNLNIVQESNVSQKQKKKLTYFEEKILHEMELIIPEHANEKITKNIINSFELSIYKKEIKGIKLNINKYFDLSSLEEIIKLKSKPGKIFIGTLSSEATKIVKKNCSKGILFFSFAVDKSLADDCVYLINFFPDNDLEILFNYFPEDSKVALLYPDNYYGHNINRNIDLIAAKSKSLLINRASYKEDLSNARLAIKELSKYELRKYELDRQKKILQNKNDEVSKKALKKIQKFETIGNVDFTHLILPDYSIRLLEIAPLLPFYDVDPNKVKFVGTGVWDDKIFFNEPSLQGALFPGIEETKRESFFKEYEYIYQEKPIRTATIPYDIVGIISYIIDKKLSLGEVYDLLNNSKIKFDGIDGKFFFTKNSIFRELNILKIENGNAVKIN